MWWLFSSACSALGVFAICRDECDDSTTTPLAIDCDLIAIAGGDGAPDPCDAAACRRSTEGCDGVWHVEESFPPQYACEGAGSWDVYDVCPDWQPPGEIFVSGVEDLGCGEATGGETLTATVDGEGRIDVLHVDYAEGCCPLDVAVHIVEGTGDLAITYSPIEDYCECICPLDVAYALEGVPSGDWTLRAGTHGASTQVVVP